MVISCTHRFYKEINTLKKNNSYRSIEKDIYQVLFGSKIDSIIAGSSKLTGSIVKPFIKKRINGSGGYRGYIFAQIVENHLMLSFIHPKSGTLGYENIKDSAKAEFYKESVEALVEGNFYNIIYVKDVATYEMATKF